MIRPLILLWGLALTIVSTPTQAQECVVAFPERLGNWAAVKEGRYIGPLIDAADAVFKAADMRVKHHGVDRWQSILSKFDDGEIDILAVAVKTADRQAKMNFVGPWINYRWGPFQLAGKDITLLERPKVGVNRALQGVWPTPTYLARLNGEPDWDTPENLMQKLVRGEIDVMLGEYEAIMKRADDMDVAVSELPNTEMRLTAYMAINKNSECLAFSPALDRAIRAWKHKGGWAKLIARVHASPRE